jgi:hypothetical protein
MQMSLSGSWEIKIAAATMICVITLSGIIAFTTVTPKSLQTVEFTRSAEMNRSSTAASLGSPAVPPSLTLLAGGAGWAAQGGKSALFVDSEDNYLAHGNTDGSTWLWFSQALMKNTTDSIAYALNMAGLDVHFAGDIPSNLTGYNLLVLGAYYAIDPSKLAIVKDFIASGGGVVLLSGDPEYFRCYCKNLHTWDLPTANTSLDMNEILGCGTYDNSGGNATVTVNNPFGTNLLAGDTVFQTSGYSNAAEWNTYVGSNVIARWEDGSIFAYTFQYGQGRVYYQAAFPLNPPGITRHSRFPALSTIVSRSAPSSSGTPLIVSGGLVAAAVAVVVIVLALFIKKRTPNYNVADSTSTVTPF